MMNQLNEKKDLLEKEIEDELHKIEKLQKELKERKKKVESLQDELREVKGQITEAKGKKKVNENIDKPSRNNKRKNTKEFVNKKKKRSRTFQEELMNEVTDEEEIDEEIIEQEELVTLFKKAYKYEVKKNRKMIEYWCNYAMKFEERIVKLMTDNEEER